jgi:succinate dehydrogenase/fumarate reductase flavoprotein subunit
MDAGRIAIDGLRIPVHSLNTIVVGSGAAALNAAVSLHDRGRRDIAVVTEDFEGGTSFNAGSDKQTYYKLSLAGGTADSPRAMAEDLFRGGCMHGDIALCEAQGSAPAFFHLTGLGVPFPHDRWGGYAGYKTDHDPRQRATSAGPLTSRMMVQALAADLRRKRVRIFDGHSVVGLLTADEGGAKRVIGALALDREQSRGRRPAFVLFNAVNVVLGTGGPAGIYAASVYPGSQTGSHGLAFDIGADGQNLTESQFGIASLAFRWNLSGTYQQVIPRYISTDRNGGDEREFLNEHFPDMGRLATAIFLKGYQWPFDPRKIADHGSSLIDLLVYRETVVNKRRVYLDFRRNPGGGGPFGEFSLDLLDSEARAYLEKSGALRPTPIERLRKMNPPAIEIFRSHGLDLAAGPLEIAVCAQHNNGGLKGGIWWESNIAHLFPVGEVNGTHGVYRPGGSALNSGQVGSLRAAQYIAARYGGKPPAEREFLAAAEARIREKIRLARQMLAEDGAGAGTGGKVRREFQERMSRHGAHIRDPKTIGREAAKAWAQLARLKKTIRVKSAADLAEGFKTLDLCLTQAVYLEAIKEYLARGGASRGSYLVLDPGGAAPCPGLGDEWSFALAGPESFVNKKIMEIGLDKKGKIRTAWADIRPIPADEAWFETVWDDFRNDRIVRSSTGDRHA